MKDNYMVSEGVRKIEEIQKGVRELTEQELKDRFEALAEIIANEEFDDFIDEMHQDLEEQGITQEDIDEYIFRTVHPELFPKSDKNDSEV